MSQALKEQFGEGLCVSFVTGHLCADEKRFLLLVVSDVYTYEFKVLLSL